jgi:hypothetical protein
MLMSRHVCVREIPACDGANPGKLRGSLHTTYPITPSGRWDSSSCWILCSLRILPCYCVNSIIITLHRMSHGECLVFGSKTCSSATSPIEQEHSGGNTACRVTGAHDQGSTDAAVLRLHTCLRALHRRGGSKWGQLQGAQDMVMGHGGGDGSENITLIHAH